MKRLTGLLLLLLLGLLISLGQVPQAQAGVFNADEEVTYKEYWISHQQFTGGCSAPLVNDENGNSWYSEPDELNKCPKNMILNIPDGISGALKAELYVDLWRNYDTKSARLRVNGNQNKTYESPVGYDWSRTPWIQEIPLNELFAGNNSFLFWGASGKYHIHDVALRVYYDNAHPIVPGGSSDVTAPDGQLVDVKSNDPGAQPIDANAGGVLDVSANNEVTLKATVDADESDVLVEFHAFYDGYDEDADGETRDWHNLLRNNWSPGGRNALPNGQFNATINHVGTVRLKPADDPQEATITWDVTDIVNQSGVRFKIRVVDEAGNARDAAGGVSAPFTLLRNYPVVAYTMPNFDDFGLHMSGNRPDVVSYTFPLPDDINLGQYQTAVLLGNYWRNPKVSVNGTSSISANPGGEWSVGRQSISKNALKPGNNDLTFSYNGGSGHFIEHPGPMIVLHGNPGQGGVDNIPPQVVSRSPQPFGTNVDVFSPVAIGMSDNAVGIDYDSILMSVNGQQVEPEFSGASNNLMVTYTPENPYPPLTEISVTLFGCDLLGNCMVSADAFSFTTEPPDEVPPIISNVNVLTTDTTATVSWLTDEGADSVLEYGLTAAYGNTVTDSDLVTQHSFDLTNLSPATTYNFRLSGTDYSGNTATTNNLTFKTKNIPGPIKSDNFSSCLLDTSIWSFINPKADSTLTLTGTGAQISVPGGSAHDLWRQGLQAPRLMQTITNQDFTVEVKFNEVPTQRTQTMGILVLQDLGNWLRFNFQNDGTSSVLTIADSNKGSVNIVPDVTTMVGSANYMRLGRVGDLWNVEYSTDGEIWSLAATIARTLVVTEIGPFVGNAGNNPAFASTIDYFENLAAPLTGTESPIQLNVILDGVGTVTKSPDKENYLCGEVVELTATPAPDWEFDSWEGAINSTNSVETITMLESEEVTAVFNNDTPYTLDVNIVSNSLDLSPATGGTVTKDPDESTYFYGDEVLLTAVPEPGWSLSGWSGDLSGTELTPTVIITGNMDITATFSEDDYTIQTLVVVEGIGEGATVTYEPVKDFYVYGDVVTFTVEVEPGWTFLGWEGDGLTGTDLVKVVTMEQDILAVARVSQSQYEIDIELIQNGTPIDPEMTNAVVITPTTETGTYGYGQVVTMTAVPLDGWTFDGWSGDIEDTALAQTVTITDDLALTATFTQEQYSLTVTTDGPGAVTIEPDKEFYVYGDAVVLTPVAEQGYDFALWTGDITGSDNPLVLPITGDTAVEAVFIVDTTPIEIISHSVEVHGLVAVVTWTTDVPGTSRVDYGEDEFYQDGSEQKEALVTNHTIQLKNLKADTRYHYQIISLDQFGNQVQSADLTFFTGTSSGLASDDFSSCNLLSYWTWVMPQGDASTYTMAGQQVEISVPARDNNDIHDIFSTGINVPRLMQASNDRDFTVEVKFESAPSLGGTMQGVVVQQDANNFLRFSMHQNAFNEVVIYSASFQNLTPGNIKSVRLFDPVSGPIWVRIVRAGDNWEYWYSLDGEDWTMHAKFDFEIEVKEVGLFAGNTRSGGVLSPHTAVVDYFFNTAAVIEPEESYYQLNFSYTGSGKVETTPNKPGFYCGEQVTLRAVGNPGWSFDSWGGDITGANPTHSIFVTDHMNIHATFKEGAFQRTIMMPVIVNP